MTVNIAEQIGLKSKYEYRVKVEGSNDLIYSTSDEFAYISRHGLLATTKGGIKKVEALMRFSGFYDSNEKEIYEGDILHIDDEYSEGFTIVRGLPDSLVIDYDFGEFDVTSVGWAMEEWEGLNATVLVMGNIYNDPDLAMKSFPAYIKEKL